MNSMRCSGTELTLILAGFAALGWAAVLGTQLPATPSAYVKRPAPTARSVRLGRHADQIARWARQAPYYCACCDTYSDQPGHPKPKRRVAPANRKTQSLSWQPAPLHGPGRRPGKSLTPPARRASVALGDKNS